MKRIFHIRHTTAVLSLVIAALVGALAATVTLTHNPPLSVATAHAASVSEQVPLGSFAPVVKRVMPAVVNISSSRVVKNQERGLNLFEDPLFRQFFGGRMPQQQEPRERSERAESLGSGVIVTPDGYILTNNHVVEGATDIKVSFSDRREFTAKVIGTDQPTDIAVIKIDDKNLPTLPLSSTVPQVGDVALAIGDPFGIGQTVTMGIVSATGRTGLGIERYEDFIQTDAAINPGNSGGALINTHGELIGINTAILAGNSGGNQGVGFAIPVNLAKNIMDQLVKTGKVRRGYIGVTLQDIDPTLAKSFGLSNNVHGVAVTSVEPNSPGSRAGLQQGDVVTEVNGQPVDNRGSLQIEVAGLQPGSVAHLKVFRDGAYRNVDVTLGEYPAKLLAENGNEQNGPGLNESGEGTALKGVSVQAITPDVRQQLNLPSRAQGVVVTDVDPNSAAAEEGLMQGDVVVQVNRKPVHSVADFSAAVKQPTGSGSTLLLVQRGQGTMFLAIPNK
jgi:serine protease Do